MGLWDKLVNELIDIVEWTDDSRDTMVWRFPRYQNEIKYGAKLIVRDETAKKLFPQIKPLNFETAVHLALGRIQRDNVETSWSDALVTVAGDVKPYKLAVEEGMFIETRQQLLDLSPEDVFRSYMGIGGERGWLYMDWAWALRGWIDKAIVAESARWGDVQMSTPYGNDIQQPSPRRIDAYAFDPDL